MELVRKHGVILLDDEDAWITHDYSVRAMIQEKGYRVARAECKKTRKSISLGRLLLGITDPDLQADHINHNGFDNRRENLRVVDRDLQNANRRFDNSTGYKGVHFSEKHGTKPYRMKFFRKGKTYHGPYRSSAELAALDYNVLSIASWGHQSVINEVRCVDMEPQPADRNCMFCNAPCHCCCVCFDPPSPGMQRLFDTLDAS